WPNLLSIRTKSEGEKSPGIDGTSDGKKLCIAAKRRKQYTEDEAPSSMTDIGQQVLRLGPPNVGMLFANLLSDDPDETLMSGVTDWKLAGTQKVDGVECHRITFKQPECDWELYVAAEGKPYVMRMTTTRSNDDTKMTVVETYKDWKIQDSADKSLFTVAPPKDAKKVDQIEQRGQEDKDKQRGTCRLPAARFVLEPGFIFFDCMEDTVCPFGLQAVLFANGYRVRNILVFT